MAVEHIQALTTFLRDRASVKGAAAELTESQQPVREGLSLLDVAGVAERLDPDDPRLGQLATAGRFAEFAGRTLFLGGGDAVFAALRDAATGQVANEAQALDQILMAALSEPPPGSDV
jgi:hypothetical protein